MTPLDIYSFDAVGDGDADDTAAVLDWAAASNGWLALPPGRFRTSEPLPINLDTTPRVVLSGAGPGMTELIYTGSGDFFSGTRSADVSALGAPCGVDVQNLTFRTTEPGTAGAVKVELADGAPGSGSYEAMYRSCRNVRFLGLGDGAYWARGVEWKNSTFSVTENIVFRGLANSGRAVVFSGNRSAVVNTVRGLNGVSVEKLVDVVNPSMEGLRINDITGVGCKRGVEWLMTGTQRPMLHVSGFHFDLVNDGIGLNLNVVAPAISDGLIYLKDTSTGIALDGDSSHADFPMFSNVSMYGITSSSNKTGLRLKAGVKRARIGGLCFTDLQTGIAVETGATDCDRIPGAIKWNACTTQISGSLPVAT